MTIPVIIVAGLAMLWFGLGDFTVMFVVALIVLPTMYVNTVAGLRTIDRDLVEMGRVYRFSRRLLLREVYLPGIASPSIAGLTLATGIAVRAVVLAEVLGAASGIGHAFSRASSLLQIREGLRLDRGAARTDGGHRVRGAASGPAAGHALAEGPAMISFEHVSKSFDSLKVLNDVSFHISSGDILGVVGPSGVGKTTMLKLITGIIAPDAGSVRVAEGVAGVRVPGTTAAALAHRPRQCGRARCAPRGWRRRPRGRRPENGWAGWAWPASSTTIRPS